jgi:type IV pilus assembly protein PilB
MVQRSKPKPQRLGEVLVEYALITREQRRSALEKQKDSGKRLGEILVEDGVLTRDELNWALGNLLGIPYVELDASMVDPEAVRAVPMELLRRYRAVPMIRFGNELTVALADPTDSQAVADISAVTGAEVKLAMADAAAVEEVLGKLAATTPRAAQPPVQLPAGSRRPPSREEMLADLSGTTLVQHHLRRACQQGADEILFQPAGETFRVRYRVHGRFVDDASCPASFLPTVVTRLKLMAGLELETGAVFQEGQVPLEMEGRALEMLASVYATVHGPGARIRIRAKRAQPWPLSKLGFERAAMAQLRRAAAAPSGLVVACGPRRAGCSTTLYALLREAASPERHVVTLQSFTTCRYPDATQLELPYGAEYLAVLGKVAGQAPGVILAEGLHGREFWSAFEPQALASTLLLGEMRAEDALSALSQLREAGVGGAVLASSLRLIVAHRLAPRLDPQEREPHKPPSHVLDRVSALVPGAADAQYYHAATDAEGRKVFRGLELIYEILEPSQEVRDLLAASAPTAELRAACERAGMTPLRECAVAKAACGLIELEEAL